MWGTIKLEGKMAVVNSVEVLVPVHNALAELRDCWGSLSSHAGNRLVRVTFVDDASNVETREWLDHIALEDSRVRVLRNRSNKGYTKSVNLGLRDLVADAIVILNSDTLVTPGAFDRLVAGVNSSEDVAAVGPLSNAASWQSIPRLTDDNGLFFINALPQSHTADDIAELVAEEFSAPQRPSVPVLNGFCTLFRAEAIRQIGFLDEKRFPRGYGEENDYCVRLSDAGYRLLVCEDAYVFHVKSASFGHETRVKLSRAGGKNFVKKHGQSRLDAMVAGVQANPELAAIRERVSRAFERRFGKGGRA